MLEASDATQAPRPGKEDEVQRDVQRKPDDPDRHRLNRIAAPGEVMREDRQHADAVDPGQQPVVERDRAVEGSAEDEPDPGACERDRRQAEEPVQHRHRAKDLGGRLGRVAARDAREEVQADDRGQHEQPVGDGGGHRVEAGFVGSDVRVHEQEVDPDDEEGRQDRDVGAQAVGEHPAAEHGVWAGREVPGREEPRHRAERMR